MPFTFCHPAIILPLTRVSKSKLSASALIAGSISPDFEYFIHMRMIGHHGHTLGGIFYFNLPITLILLLVFHLIVRDTLLQNLPKWCTHHVSQLQGFDWLNYAKSNWYVVIYSTLIGVSSHLFWDSFTHQGRFFAEAIPWLHGSIDVFGVRLLRTEFAQLFSSLIGALIIAIVLFRPQTNGMKPFFNSQTFTYWTLACGSALLIILIRNPYSISEFIATSISASLLGLIIAPLILKLVAVFLPQKHKM